MFFRIFSVTDTGSRSQSICNDSMAAYVNAVEWYMTGNQKYANTAIAIMNAWASTCTTINGSNAQLAAAFDFYDMVNAAEIIRYSGAGWSAADITKFQNFLTNVVYPPCSPSSTNGWGASANVMMMQIGVFCDNQTIYNQGYNNFTGTNASVACWTSLFDTNSASVGQVSESGRDQGHAQLIVRCGLEAAEIALNSSGQNLFTFHNNLLFSATEYTAKYNLGHAVTWDGTFGSPYQYGVSASSRGNFTPMYAMAKAGFSRSGLTGTYTNQVVAAEGIESSDNQACGLGTLLYTQASTSRPAPQYALVNYPQGYLMAGNNGANSITAVSPCIRTLETFQEVIQGNGYSALKSAVNGKYVTVNGTTSLLANSTTVGTAQLFKVIDMGNANVCLVSQLNGKMVTAGSNSIMAASLTYSTSTYNQMTMRYVGPTIPAVQAGFDGHTYRINNVNSGQVVDNEGSSYSPGPVDQYPWTGTASQQWLFTNSGDGFYTLKNGYSGLYLDVIGQATDPDSKVDQYGYNGGLNQFWVVQSTNPADNTAVYNLYSPNVASKLNLLEVPGASNNQNVQLAVTPPNGGSCQQWTITAP